AIRAKDVNKAAAALSAAESRFRAAAKEADAAGALESTLSKLDDGRQTIAQAGASTTKKGQVGFRRSAPADANSGSGQDQSGDSTQQTSGGAPNGVGSGSNGANIGQNQPALSTSSGPGPGTLPKGGGASAG